MTTLQSAGILLVAVAATCYFLRRLCLPKPIPGIPYNPASANRILGDVPDALAWKEKTGSLYNILHERAKELDSPIFQIFLQPLGRPWVVVVDPYEAQAIRTYRMQDFDRSRFFEQIFKVMLPEFHGHMPTGEEWKSHRRLLSDTMSPRFLQDVAAPKMWDSAMRLIELWKLKAKLADGRSWSASTDVYKGALDIVWAATFGEEMGSAKAQIAHLSKYEKLDGGEGPAVTFPTAKDPEDFTCILDLGEGMEYPINSMWPKMAHWLVLNFFPIQRKARSRKDKMITKQLQDAHAKFSKLAEAGDLESNKHFRSALDLVVAREVQMANKEGRAFDPTSRVLNDELFAFMIAGHDTSSTFILWGLKFLTDNQEVQRKLQAALREAFPEHDNDDSVPSVGDINRASLPYLEAIMEEIGRCGHTAPATFRLTKNDTQILGHHVPKGIDVVFPVQGTGYVSPLVGKLEDDQREKASLAQKQKWGMWDTKGIERFDPERWLKKDAQGHLYCDRDAGPANAFGSGPRACFGKKWALMEIKIILTLVFWHFELLPTPPELSSHRASDGITHRPIQNYIRLKEIR
ncbi:hypothetical protein CKM354_001121400 [Cercospora kikuchii]|uniref:Cytochrome P450 monooxygenase TRI13 n=1 Tax=Cercospora kikuchii TaxID=84275 RepID=A0A9P3CT60_9PEZI|nr:uncharacterized protein CKM354_001121400 [Cercospora kikuchii]GIZ48141.1 hypothetical protein CKM354_001121400 [Cercospora kikuchii]